MRSSFSPYALVLFKSHQQLSFLTKSITNHSCESGPKDEAYHFPLPEFSTQSCWRWVRDTLPAMKRRKSCIDVGAAIPASLINLQGVRWYPHRRSTSRRARRQEEKRMNFNICPNSDTCKKSWGDGSLFRFYWMRHHPTQKRTCNYFVEEHANSITFRWYIFAPKDKILFIPTNWGEGAESKPLKHLTDSVLVKILATWFFKIDEYQDFVAAIVQTTVSSMNEQ